ncbi:MAG: ABC transporter permease [Candidatus Bathyarchaeia archaeon]|nr:ABC transporter permease [Candidatus Bathyarchaeota archaeon]
MLKGFGNFLLKELKELARDPKILLGMIIVPMVIFPVIGGVMGYAIQSAKEQAVKMNIFVVNNDAGEWSIRFINFLKELGVQVQVLENIELKDENVQWLLSSYNATMLLEIPPGFSKNVTAYFSNPNTKAYLRFYGVITSASFFETAGSSMVDSLVNQFNRCVAPDVLLTEKSTVIKGEVKRGIDPAMISSLMMSQSIALPVTVMILLTYSVQIAATSVAMEKEEKTLETLLTIPMDRFAILLGKLSSSVIIAAVGAVAYMVGYGYMVNIMLSDIPGALNLDLASLGLAPSPAGYLLLGVSLFVTIFSALALAVILSAFAEDVRSAQSYVGFIYPFVFLPAFALMYLDISALPLAVRLLFYAIPFSHPIIASKAVLTGDYFTVVIGIIYVSIFTIVIMYIASRLFATEKILTMKLRFKGLKRRGTIVSEES